MFRSVAMLTPATRRAIMTMEVKIMSEELEKVKRMSKEERRVYWMKNIQEYREMMDRVEDPELVRLLEKAARTLSEDPEETDADE